MFAYLTFGSKRHVFFQTKYTLKININFMWNGLNTQ